MKVGEAMTLGVGPISLDASVLRIVVDGHLSGSGAQRPTARPR